MTVICTKAFPGVPEGETQVKRFSVGDELTGRLAEVALAEGWAEEKGEETEKPAAPRRRGRPKKG